LGLIFAPWAKSIALLFDFLLYRTKRKSQLLLAILCGLSGEVRDD